MPKTSALPASSPTVLIYRNVYNQLSETFVRDHVHGLRRFRPLVLTNRIDTRGPAVTAEVAVVPAEGRVTRRLWERGLAWQVDRLLWTRRPALIHAHFLFDGARILPYARRHNIPLVITAHGYDATLTREALAERAEGQMLLAREAALKAQAALVLCVSDFIRDELLERGWPAAKLVTQPLGVDTAALVPAPAAGRRGILTVGRLVEKKGTRFLIDAYARLPEQLRAAHPLTIIGDGPLRAELEVQAAALGVSVDFVGGQPRERILAAMARAEIFCFPSIRAANGDAEGMGVAIMEALALGTPVVLFDNQPAAPILAAASAGVSVPAGDAETLATAIERGLIDKSLREVLVLQGRSLVKRIFDQSENLHRLEKLYDLMSITSRVDRVN